MFVLVSGGLIIGLVDSIDLLSLPMAAAVAAVELPDDGDKYGTE
jgi:hypothetical protein